MATVLVIDDDPEIRTTMESMVGRMGLSCLTAGSLAQGLDQLAASDVDVVFLDVRLPDGNGLDALPGIKEAPSRPEVIILTGKGDPDGAELAIQGGAWDYLVKPSPVKQTRLILQRAMDYRAEKKNRGGPVALDTEGIIGKSPAIRKCLDVVAMAASSSYAVLITGETGTGKELFARTIHLNSQRRDADFVVVDCAALPEPLMESILFGHKRGAFTSASQDSIGLIKQADGGTLFLDEVGELDLSAQKVFLRVLQERRFRPVGARNEESSNFRLIAATNRNLVRMVEQGRFRQDLYYRLKAVTLNLPPLRQRPADIKALIIYYANYLSEREQISNKGVDTDFMAIMAEYLWPGNVRELFHCMEQAFVAAGDETTIFAMHLPDEIRIKVARTQFKAGDRPDSDVASGRPAADASLPKPPFPEGLLSRSLPDIKAFKQQMEKVYLEHLIARHGNDLNAMVRISGLSRSHLYALIKRHGITFKSSV